MNVPLYSISFSGNVHGSQQEKDKKAENEQHKKVEKGGKSHKNR